MNVQIFKRMLENPTQYHIKILFNITLWISNLGQNKGWIYVKQCIDSIYQQNGSKIFFTGE